MAPDHSPELDRVPALNVIGGAPPRLRGWLIALLASLIGLGTALIGESRWLAADDDNLWLAALVRADSSAQLRSYEDQVIAILRSHGASSGDTVRFEKRRDYGGNYIGAIALWRFAANRFAAAANQAQASASDLAKRMTLMFAFGCTVVWLGFGVVVAQLRDPRLQRATVLGLAFIALWFALLPIEFSLTLGLEKSPAHLVPETIFTLLRPHDGLSLFGFTGRNLFAVLFLAAILCRWSGKDRLSAVLLLLATLLHGSYGSMMLPFVLLSDLINRRKNLHDPIYVTTIALLAIYSFGSETLWRTTLQLDRWVWVGAALAVVAALVLLRHLRTQAAQPAQRGRPLDDMAVMAGLWLATLPVALLMCQIADPISVKYFWTQLHARTLGVLQPVLAIVLGLWLLNGQTLTKPFKAIVISLAIALPLGGLQGILTRDGAVARVAASYTKLQLALTQLPAQLPLSAIKSQQEELIYFAIERTLSGQTNVITARH